MIGFLGISAGPLDGVVRLLAVVGGAALGAFAVGLLIRLAGRWMGVRRVPGTMVTVVRLLAAVVAGWLVWLLVFGTGGGGLGGPGGSGIGGSPGTGKGHSSERQPATRPDTTNRRGHVLAIEILGGNRVQEGRFYKVAGEKDALTLAALKDVLKKRQQAGEVQGIEIIIYASSVYKESGAVTALEDWAKQHDLAVTMSFPAGEAP
jgi:hypothetical protein